MRKLRPGSSIVIIQTLQNGNERRKKNTKKEIQIREDVRMVSRGAKPSLVRHHLLPVAQSVSRSQMQLPEDPFKEPMSALRSVGKRVWSFCHKCISLPNPNDPNCQMAVRAFKFNKNTISLRFVRFHALQPSYFVLPT